MTVVPFGEWLPDVADYANPGCLVAKNVLPGSTGYKPIGSLSPISTALDSRPRGAITVRDSGDVVRLYAADEGKIYELASTTWSNRSKSGGYSTPSEENWEFAPWKNKLLAVNFGDNPQEITLGGSAFSDLTTDFKARHIGVVRDFVVVGNTFDATDDFKSNRVRWSAFNNEADWTVSTVTGSGYEDLKTGGQVRRIVGGEYGVVVCESSVYRMSFVGAPQWFQFDETLPGVGTFAPGSVAQLGDLVFFWSEQGFIALSNGTQANYIGATKVDDFARNDLDATYFYRISATVDPKSRRVFWAYPGSGNTAGRPNKILCFDIDLNKWSLIEHNVELVWRAGGASYSLEDLDSISTSIDDMTVSFDSDRWRGDAPQLSAFDENFKHGFFDGTPMDGEIIGREMEGTPGRRNKLTGFSLLVDGGTTTAQVGHRRKQSDAVTWTDSLTETATGRYTPRVNAKFFRIKAMMTGNWTDVIGPDLPQHTFRGAEYRG